MRMNATDIERTSVDTSCIILENDVPVINLDESADKKLMKCDDNIVDASILKICFKDAATYSELNSLIARCVKNALFHLQKSVICTEDSLNFTLVFNETSNDDNSLFIVDSAPSEAPEISNVIPEYSRSEVVINNQTAQVDENKDDSVTTSKIVQNTCFNCNGNHAIKDCTKPKDLNRIRQNRAKFSSSKVNYERYHVDVEQRFGHLVAGELSKDLRIALGLRSKELPMHIYRMRMLGYPPGWLEHAKVSSSGLTMFDSEGKGDDANENDVEDKYDLKKIISFPGFNVEAPHGTLDESRSYRAPPMEPSHSKACMIEFLKSRSTKAYKRKAMQNTDITVLEPTDMDIDDESDDDVPNMPLEERVDMLPTSDTVQVKESLVELEPSVAIPESQSPLSDGEIAENEVRREDSPTLDDLNEHKKRLLVALDDSTISVTPLITPLSAPLEKKSPEDDSLIEDIMALQDDSVLESSGVTDENGDSSKVDNGSPSTSDSPPATPRIGKRSLHTSKKTVRGTPVIQGVSPFNNLPNSENWAAGVSDVMDFENLPEYIGKYEKMRTLLGKVRAKVKKIQYENEDR